MTTSLRSSVVTAMFNLQRHKAQVVPAALALASLALASCGGGGGGSSATEINAANAPVVAANVIAASIASADIGGEAGLGSQVAGAGSGPVARRLANLTRRTASRVQPAATVTDTIDCAVSGSFTARVRFADEAALAPGDVIDVRFNLCDDGENELLNGGVKLRLVSLEGDVINGDDYLLVADATFSEFTSADERGVVGADGAARIEIDTRGFIADKFTLSGQRLRVFEGGNNWTLTDFAIIAIDTGLGCGIDLGQPQGGCTVTNISASGTLQSTDFDGAVDFVTVLPFGIQSTDGDVTTGQLDIIGADNASVRINVSSSRSVDLLLDLDGNGSFEQTIDTTWATLLAAVS